MEAWKTKQGPLERSELVSDLEYRNQALREILVPTLLKSISNVKLIKKLPFLNKYLDNLK